MSGEWRISYSLQSRVYSGDYNIAFLFINGEELDDTIHFILSETGEGQSTGGREVTMEASAGDKIEFRVTRMDGDHWRIIFCAEFITKL